MKKLSFQKYHIATALIAVAFFCNSALAATKTTDTSKKAVDPSSKEASNSSTASDFFANGPKKHALGLGIGQTFLTGNFADNGEDKITFDVMYSYNASYSFDVLADLYYSKHQLGEKSVTTAGASFGVKSKFFQFDSFSPYVLGGLGFYRPTTVRDIDGVLTASTKKVVFGSHVGVGSDLKLNERVSVGILGHYHNPFDVKQETGGDIEGSYFKLLLTAAFIFY
ncbi:MAG: hypothetical protein HOE90_06890 [Bacteriovoracaceae bacterium]|jgi:hypothetical protein|nr:hypothetical protein [Bacteriovoracaceae bacterium]